MFGRPLMLLGLALALSSCSKAESKKSESPPESAKPAPERALDTDDITAPEGKAEVKIEPVQVQVKGLGGDKEVADPKQVQTPTPTKEAPKPEPAPGAPDANDSSFQLTVEQPAAVAAGGETTLRVRVTPGKGYKMNAEFPTKLTFEPAAGVSLGKTALALSDAEKFDDHQLVFAVKATPAAAGSYTVTGKIKFAVCTDATCDPKKRSVSFAVTAK